MDNYVNFIKLVFGVFGIITTSTGIPVGTLKFSPCLKGKNLFTNKDSQFNCIQKCIWNKIGILHHDVLKINSPRFENQYKPLFNYDYMKLIKFKKCIQKSLIHLKIKKCEDIAIIDSCYNSVHKNAIKRVILLVSAYGVNKMVGAVVDPLVEGSARLLYGIAKDVLPSSLTDPAEKLVHNLANTGYDIKKTILITADGLANGVSSTASHVADGANHIKNFITDLGGNIIGVVDDNLAKGIDTVVGGVTALANHTIAVVSGSGTKSNGTLDEFGLHYDKIINDVGHYRPLLTRSKDEKIKRRMNKRRMKKRNFPLRLYNIK